jgi:N-acetylglutamate synthase-like GNAT family acetyltransferase
VSVFFVRSAGAGDLEKVLKLIEAGAAAPSPSVQSLKADLLRPDSEFVVADDGKRIGGMGYAAMAKDEADVVILHRLNVDPDLKGQGIGRDLFAELETCFPNARRMRVEVAKDNTDVLRFFSGLGFAEVGWAKQASGSSAGSEALILEKPLEF